MCGRQRPRRCELTWPDFGYISVGPDLGLEHGQCLFFLAFPCFLASSFDHLSHSGIWGWNNIYMWHSRALIFSPGANCPPCSVTQGQQQHKFACLKPPLLLSFSRSLSLSLFVSQPPVSSLLHPTLSVCIDWPCRVLWCVGVMRRLLQVKRSTARFSQTSAEFQLAPRFVACFQEFGEGNQVPLFVLYAPVLKYLFRFWAALMSPMKETDSSRDVLDSHDDILFHL